jgi:hypothetical protein
MSLACGDPRQEQRSRRIIDQRAGESSDFVKRARPQAASTKAPVQLANPERQDAVIGNGSRDRA